MRSFRFSRWDLETAHLFLIKYLHVDFSVHRGFSWQQWSLCGSHGALRLCCLHSFRSYELEHFCFPLIFIDLAVPGLSCSPEVSDCPCGMRDL